MSDPADRLNVDIALAVAAMREQAGLTQQQVAKLAGISQPLVSLAENPTRITVSVRVLARIAAACSSRILIICEPIGIPVDGSGPMAR